MRIEIKARFTGAVLFAHDADNNTLRITLEAAVFAGANLEGANLKGAYLKGAYLAGANLKGANLEGANLEGANLAGANLKGAYLAGANLKGAYLEGAYLAGANLEGAYLEGAYLAGANLKGAYLEGAYLAGANLEGAYLAGKQKLIGGRPILQIGPIGSRGAYLAAYLTDQGVMIRAGCWFGTRDEFESRVTETHGGNEHAREYRAALAIIDAHAEIWTPVTEQEKDAE